jgi:hypothetical protein
MWVWPALFFLGSYHGINPGMGWLFAVSLGMQEKNRRSVWKALLPIAVGHGLAVGAAIALADLLRPAFSLSTLKVSVAVLLFGFGLWRLVSHRHPRWGGMQVGFRDLTIWSFLMASVHGAGLMVLPVFFEVSAAGPVAGLHGAGHFQSTTSFGAPEASLPAIAVHTAGYLLATGGLAVLVYERWGLRLLRTAWINLDVIWAAALAATGCFVLLT